MPEFYIGLNSDIVFLLNVTGSMSNSLPSLKIILTNLAQKIEEEVKKISHSDNVRYKVCGFRDQEFDGDKWFIDLPFVRNIEEVSNHLNHRDMEPFGGTGKATSLLDAIYKIGMMPVNASKTIEDSNKWRRSGCGTRHIILIFTDATFKNATLPEISGFGCFEIYNKLADKKLILFGLVPEWSGYDDLGAFPNSRFNYYIKEAEYADLGKPGQEGDAAKLANQQALDNFLKEGDGFESLLESLRTKIFATSSRHPDYWENLSNEERSDDLNQTNTPTAQQFPNGMNVGFTNDTVIETETRKGSETEPEKIAGGYKGSRIDIVFLLDVTGSMEKCLALLKLNLINFIKSIEDKLKDGSNYGEIILNARYKVCGFRDQEFDGDKWFIEFPFVRNIEEVSNHLNHRDMEPFGGTGKATSLLDAIYKIGMMSVNASKTLEDSNKWRGGTKHWIFLVSNSTFKNATIPEIAGFGSNDIYNKIADKKLILFGLVPEWIGYDGLNAYPKSRFTYFIREAEYADQGKTSPEGDAAQIAFQQALDKFSIEGNGFESLFESLRDHIKNVFEIDDDLEKIDIEHDINFENLSNEGRSDDLNQTNTPTAQQLPDGINVSFTNDTVIEDETRKDSGTEPEKIAGALKGVVDIVFLLDVTSGREPCLNAIKSNLTNFAQTITDNLECGVNGPVITLDARYKVCGYRDQSCDGDKWFIEFPFVRNIEDVKTHMNHADMSSCGGGDEPESLLDGLYKVGMMPVCDSKEPEDPTKWRKGAMHCVLIFTDATFKNATLPEIEGFGVEDIYNKIADKKLVLFGLVPEWSGYDDLSAFPNSNLTYYIKGHAVANLGKSGPEGDAAGAAAVTACHKMSIDKDTFKSFMEILAKAISWRFCKHN